MIVYKRTKKEFLNDVLSNEIEEIIRERLSQVANRRVSASELISWQNSLRFMGAVVKIDGIPEDAGICIEFCIPQTNKRIDFIITGQDANGNDQVIVIELKQWSSATLTDKDGVVKTQYKHGVGESNHPSYQAWSYCETLKNFNQTVEDEDINLVPCAYLHNYIDDEVIRNPLYEEYISKAPVFLSGKGERDRLSEFVKSYIKQGDSSDVMLRIENGKIRPSKSLAESLAKMFKGNPEFVMLDEQKLVYETALKLARESQPNNKNVLIVQGGPGTGKSVVAVSLLVNLTHKQNANARYVTKNAAPRDVYQARLSGTLKKSVISTLFTSSGSFHATTNDEFDVLIVDEAHRLNEKSGMFKNFGENQVKEIIEASKLSIFFIDEDQRVTFSDIGSEAEIENWARVCGAHVHKMQLDSQFRCNGSDGYLAWLDDVLDIRQTANKTMAGIDFDFRVFDDPSELQSLIYSKNGINNKARIVAGYCWNWVSRGDKSAYDIRFPLYGFQMKWNLDSDRSLWIQAPNSVTEIGCIHTCQGLEVDYIGVVVGPDLIVRDGVVITDPVARAKTDKSLSGYKKLLKTDPIKANKMADAIIKNTYRTLMTRGMKGCYIYSSDPETQAYFEERMRARH